MYQRRGLDASCRNRLNPETLRQPGDDPVTSTLAASRQSERHDTREFRSHARLVYLESSPDHYGAGNARQPVAAMQ